MNELIKSTRINHNPSKKSVTEKTYLSKFKNKENGNGDVAEIFHENTKWNQTQPILSNSIEYWENRDEESTGHLPATTHDELELITLPDPDLPSTSIREAVEGQRETVEYSGDPVILKEIGTLLGSSCGVTCESGDLSTIGSGSTRAYPSAGSMHPVKPYVIILDSNGIESGYYYYSAEDHGLRVIEQKEKQDILTTLESAFHTSRVNISGASMVVLLTGEFWRSKVRFGPRGYRSTLLEAGHIAQNIRLIASVLGLGSVTVNLFEESIIDPLLLANGVDESTLYGLVLGTPSSKEEQQ